MPTTLIAATCGFAEESRCSWLFFRALEPFDTGIGALHNLACGLLKQYEEEWQSSVKWKQCCEEFSTRKAERDRYCPVCRTELKPHFSIEHWQQWLSDKHADTADTWGREFDEACAWDPWPSLQEIAGTPADEILVLPANAEVSLTMALRGDELPETPGYSREIEELWEGIRSGISDWDRETGWDGSREAFARNLEVVAEDGHRIGPGGDF